MTFPIMTSQYPCDLWFVDHVPCSFFFMYLNSAVYILCDAENYFSDDTFNYVPKNFVQFYTNTLHVFVQH